MQAEDLRHTSKDKLVELTKKNLVSVQYSCSGNGNSIDEEEYIPIVNSKQNNNTKNEDKTKNS
jgi:hypothetical protein